MSIPNIVLTYAQGFDFWNKELYSVGPEDFTICPEEKGNSLTFSAILRCTSVPRESFRNK